MARRARLPQMWTQTRLPPVQRTISMYLLPPADLRHSRNSPAPQPCQPEQVVPGFLSRFSGQARDLCRPVVRPDWSHL